MIETKRKLILATIILDFISVAIMITGLVFVCVTDKYVPAEYLSYEQYLVNHIFAIVIMAIDFGTYLSAAICLCYSIRKNGTLFAESRKVFLAGFVLNIISGPLSIATILLYLALFINNNTNVEDGNVEVVIEEKPTDDLVKEKIEKLRKLKEDGVISEEEFNQQIMKLL